MSSSGIRLGAIDYLRWKDIVPICDDDNSTKVIAAKLMVYPGEPEQYYTFISPEAYSSLLNWMNFRESHGEMVTGDSWVFRNLWETRNIRFSELNKLASNPIRFGSTGVKTLLSRAWHIQGVWPELKEGKKSVLEGVPASLPALVKASRIQDKVAGVGFDWEEPQQVIEKLKEELEELQSEIQVMDQDKMEAEFGDVLFSMINYARFLKINPEDALERTNKKFIKRFQYLEEKAKENNTSLSEMSLAEMDVFWEEAKRI